MLKYIISNLKIILRFFLVKNTMLKYIISNLKIILRFFLIKNTMLKNTMLKYIISNLKIILWFFLIFYAILLLFLISYYIFLLNLYWELNLVDEMKKFFSYFYCVDAETFRQKPRKAPVLTKKDMFNSLSYSEGYDTGYKLGLAEGEDHGIITKKIDNDEKSFWYFKYGRILGYGLGCMAGGLLLIFLSKYVDVSLHHPVIVPVVEVVVEEVTEVTPVVWQDVMDKLVKAYINETLVEIANMPRSIVVDPDLSAKMESLNAFAEFSGIRGLSVLRVEETLVVLKVARGPIFWALDHGYSFLSVSTMKKLFVIFHEIFG